ncbi:DUF354 domain-containing protein, partial [bacterium]|nr:DUF354 domain-containing protein [bacterium]
MLVDITHPAHVHFFKHSLWIWLEKGHDVIVTSRDKDLTVYLLDCYGFKHINLGHHGTTPFELAQELLVRCTKLHGIVRRERPDILTAIAGTFIAPVGRLTGTPSVTFYDTEHATISNSIAYPLSRHLVLPSCYRRVIKRPHLTYNGYHELAYLHPAYFKPDPSVLNLLGLTESDPFIIMRFVSMKSGHDIGYSGLSAAMKRKAVQAFSPHGRVFITSEKELPDDLEPYRMQIPPEKIHDALYYASLLYGESATMASEAAVLGTPAVYIDRVGRGYTDEQERVYGAVFNFSDSAEDQERSIQKGIELLTTPRVKELWREKRDRILSEKIDVTRYITDLIENLGG